MELPALTMAFPRKLLQVAFMFYGKMKSIPPRVIALKPQLVEAAS